MPLYGPAIPSASFLNVKDLGATGNGSTDDTAAIQATIAAAAAAKGTVFFPPGSYLVTGLTVPSGVTLRGAGGQQFGPTFAQPNANTVSRLLLKAASTAAILTADDSGAQPSTSVVVGDLMLDSNNVAKGAINLADSGVFFTRWWLVERCYVTGMSGSSGYAIYIGQNNGGVTLREVTAFNGRSGSPAGPDGVGWYGQDGLMDHVSIGWWGKSGVVALGGSGDQNLRITNSDIYTNGSSGLVVAGGGVRVAYTSLDHNQNSGAYIANGPAVFIGCTFHANSQASSGGDSNIKLGANNLTVQVSDCSAFTDAGYTTNLPKYMVDCGAYTGITLLESGNLVEGGLAANFTTGWSNYTGPQVTNFLAASTSTSGNLASITLPPGTWRITGRVSLYYGSTNVAATAWISPNSNSQTGQYDVQQAKVGNGAGGVTNSQIVLNTVQTFTAQTTVYLSATLNSANALAVATGTDGHSTGIEAVPVGPPRYH